MAIVTLRVDEEMKRKMERQRHINWSEVLREAINRKLGQEGGRNLAKALLINDDLRRKAPRGWDSVKVIRYWREHRYGRSSHRR